MVNDMTRKSKFCTLDLSSGCSYFRAPARSPECPTRKRLTEAFARLGALDRERANGKNPIFAKFIEQRIIWRELLELEVQEADEQIERMSAVAFQSPEHG